MKDTVHGVSESRPTTAQLNPTRKTKMVAKTLRILRISIPGHRRVHIAEKTIFIAQDSEVGGIPCFRQLLA